MDKQLNEAPPVPVRYGPPPATAPALAVLALILVLAGLNTDTAGKVGGAVAAALLFAGALWASRGPVLVADADGLRIRGLWGRRQLRWAEIRGVRGDDRRRGRALELETESELVCVAAILLGHTPLVGVTDTLTALWREAAARPG